MGGIVDQISSGVGIGPIFGNESQSGFLGTGQYMGGVYQGNKDAFYSNPNYDADRKQMQEAYDVMANREAPTAQAASMSDPSIAAAQGSAQTAQGSNVGSAFDRAAAQSNQYAQTQAAQAQAAKVQGANTNQAATQLGWGGQTGINANAQAANIGKMQNAQASLSQGTNIDQSQQAQFRNQQGQLANMQMQAAQGKGPSIANMQLQQGLGANLQNQMAAAQSQRGFGNAGASQRNLANNAAAANMQTQQAAAQMRVGETLAARQQLADLSANARAQDIGLAQNQAQLGQQNQQFNAANQQQMALANQGYANQAIMQQAAMQQQMNLANQQAQNTGALTQAGLTSQQQLANQQYQNQIAMQNAANQQQMGMFNAANQQQAGMFNAANQQQMYQQNLANQQQQNLANQQAQMQATGWNQQAANQYGMQQAGFNQQTALANQQAQLSTNQMNNQAGIGIMGMQMQGDLQQQQNQMAYEQMMAQQYSNLSNTNAQAYGQAQQSKSGILGGIASMLGGLSDKREKENIKSMKTQSVDQWLSSNALDKPEEEKSPWSWENFAKAMKIRNDISYGYPQDQTQYPNNYQNLSDVGAALGQKYFGGSGVPITMSDENEKIGKKQNPGYVEDNDYLKHVETDPTSSGLQSSSVPIKKSSTGALYLEPGAQPHENEYIKPGARDSSGGILGNFFGDLLGSVFSDERCKTKIKSGKPEIKEFIDNVHPHEFDYKHPNLPGADDKTHYSPMAQELEKSEIGRSMVYDTPNGKMVDFGRGLGAMLAVQAQFNERLKKLEGGRK